MDIRTKEKIIAMIRDGATTETIIRKFPIVTKGTIAAIRAHVTRGTHD